VQGTWQPAGYHPQGYVQPQRAQGNQNGQQNSSGHATQGCASMMPMIMESVKSLMLNKQLMKLLKTKQPAHDAAYEQPDEQAYEQADDQPDDQAYDQAYDQPDDQAYDQPDEQAYEQPNEQAYEQAYEQPNEQAYEQAYEQPDEQAYEQPNEQAY